MDDLLCCCSPSLNPINKQTLILLLSIPFHSDETFPLPPVSVPFLLLLAFQSTLLLHPCPFSLSNSTLHSLSSSSSSVSSLILLSFLFYLFLYLHFNMLNYHTHDTTRTIYCHACKIAMLYVTT